MDASRTLSDSLLVAASRELKGKARRAFVANSATHDNVYSFGVNAPNPLNCFNHFGQR